MEKNYKNIILIGPPGAGKTTIGKLLSLNLSKGFIDTDKLISLAVDDTLQNYINQNGMENFKELEEEIVSTLSTNNSIISTGGSVVYSEKSMKNLKKLGTIIYLDVPNDKIIERISYNPDRGIVKKEGQTVEEVLNERKPLYSKWADHTLQNVFRTPYLGALEITKLLRKINANTSLIK